MRALNADLDQPLQDCLPDDLTQKDRDNLYWKIRPAVRYFRNPLQIKAPRQVQALLGQTSDQWKDETDNWGNTPAHFAAWSGSPEALDWVKANCPVSNA